MQSRTDHNVSQISLPWEIVLLVIELLAQPHKDAILPSSHTITKTLLVLTRVCRGTYPTASRLLWRHCVYLDSSQKSEQFLSSLSTASLLERPWLASEPASVFLSPFADQADDETSETSASASQPESELNQDETASESSSSSFFWRSSPLNDLPTACLVQEILFRLSPVLRKLVIDMPLRSLYTAYDDQGVRPVLRRGFEALTNLEEFVSIRDELYIDLDEEPSSQEPLVWATKWPSLRRLGLYNLDLDSGRSVWDAMAELSHLDTVVFTRPDAHGVDIKQRWADATRRGSIEVIQRRLKCIFVDWDDKVPMFSRYEDSWRALDPENLLQIVKIAVALRVENAGAGESGFRDACPVESCQVWIKKHALSGTLWDTSFHERTTVFGG
jgi:hypothetical protein